MLDASPVNEKHRFAPKFAMIASRFFPFCLMALACAGCSLRAPGPSFALSPSEQRMAELVLARLELAREVAWAKYLDGRPVKDPQRESLMLAALLEEGTRRGLPPRKVEEFFGAQIAASRRLQAELIHSWKRGGPLPPLLYHSLAADLRPRLDRINAQLLDELSQTSFRPQFRRFLRGYLRSHGCSWTVSRIAAAGVRP